MSSETADSRQGCEWGTGDPGDYGATEWCGLWLAFDATVVLNHGERGGCDWETWAIGRSFLLAQSSVRGGGPLATFSE